jgi:hypothetical protein
VKKPRSIFKRDIAEMGLVLSFFTAIVSNAHRNMVYIFLGFFLKETN